LDEFVNRGHSALQYRTQIQRAYLTGLQQRLRTLSPLSTLDRGFAIVALPDGQFVHSISQINRGDHINIRLRDGQIGAEVRTISEIKP